MEYQEEMGGTVLLVPKDHLVQLVPLALRERRGQWDQGEMWGHQVRVDLIEIVRSKTIAVISLTIFHDQ